MLSPEENPLPGHAKYEVLEQLGKGGMGAVYRARHGTLGTNVVVKMLHAELSHRPTLIDRMRLEAQALARLDHPNLVRVTDFDHTPGGRPYLVMEYLKGHSLRQLLALRGGTIGIGDALSIVQQALKGLQVAHDAGLIHRDIKLDNIFVCEAADGSRQRGNEDRIGTVKLLDFGVAKVLSATTIGPAPLQFATGTGLIVGTPRFFAPEQARGETCDHRADLYAMGLVLYVLLAGRGPFDDAQHLGELAKAHISRQPEPPSRFADETLPAALDAAVMRCLAKAPDGRFASATELGAQLKQIADAFEASGRGLGAAQRSDGVLDANETTRLAQGPKPDSGDGTTAPLPRMATRPRPAAVRPAIPSAYPAILGTVAHPSLPPNPVKTRRRKGYSWLTLMIVLVCTVLLGAAIAWLIRKGF